LKVINPNKQNEDVSDLKVNINEKMDRIHNMIEGGGSLMFNGKIIEKPEEVNFAN